VATAVDSARLNMVLRKTAGLHLRFGVLFIVGVLLSGLIPWPGLP
jgi:hypothetical protein